MIVLSDKTRNAVIDKTLKEHYRETMECKNVPSDYLLMFTEGGEANAIAYEIERRVIIALFHNCDLASPPLVLKQCQGAFDVIAAYKLEKLKTEWRKK